MSEKGKDEEREGKGRRRIRGRQEGYWGMMEAGGPGPRGGKRTTRMNVEAARETLNSSRMEERWG